MWTVIMPGGQVPFCQPLEPYVFPADQIYWHINHSRNEPPLGLYRDLLDAMAWVSSWPLNEGAGPTYFDRGHFNNGTASGGVTFGEPGPLVGQLTGALRFAGAGAGQMPDSHGGVYHFSHDVSFCVWARWTGLVGGVLAGFTAGSTDSTVGIIRALPDGTVRLTTMGGTCRTARLYNDGAWHMFTCVVAGGTGPMSLIVDGVVAATQAGDGTVLGHTTVPTGIIGAFADGSFPFTGDLSEVTFFPEALSASACSNLFYAGRQSLSRHEHDFPIGPAGIDFNLPHPLGWYRFMTRFILTPQSDYADGPDWWIHGWVQNLPMFGALNDNGQVAAARFNPASGLLDRIFTVVNPAAQSFSGTLHVFGGMQSSCPDGTGGLYALTIDAGANNHLPFNPGIPLICVHWPGTGGTATSATPGPDLSFPFPPNRWTRYYALDHSDPYGVQALTLTPPFGFALDFALLSLRAIFQHGGAIFGLATGRIQYDPGPGPPIPPYTVPAEWLLAGGADPTDPESWTMIAVNSIFDLGFGSHATWGDGLGTGGVAIQPFDGMIFCGSGLSVYNRDLGLVPLDRTMIRAHTIGGAWLPTLDHPLARGDYTQSWGGLLVVCGGALFCFTMEGGGGPTTLTGRLFRYVNLGLWAVESEVTWESSVWGSEDPVSLMSDGARLLLLMGGLVLVTYVVATGVWSWCILGTPDPRTYHHSTERPRAHMILTVP